MSTHYMQNNVSKLCTCDYVNMCGTDDKFSVDTVCSDVNGSVHNESAIVQLSSAVYCLCVLTEQHRTGGISNGSVHNDSAIVQLSSAVYCLYVLTEQHRTGGISNTATD